MKKIKRIVKVIIVSVFLFLALGYCGQMDYEYAQQESMMATYWEK